MDPGELEETLLGETLRGVYAIPLEDGMRQLRSIRQLAVLAALVAFATTGCSDDPDDDDGSASAVMKFCNDLSRGTELVTLTVDFAGVTASALSGECSPVVPDACVGIPTGANPSVELREGAAVIISGSFPTLTVAEGDELLVLATIDDATGEPSVFAETFATIFGTSCASTDPITAPPL